MLFGFDSEPRSADHIAGYVGAFERKRDQAREVVQLKMPLTVNAAVDRTLERKVQHETTPIHITARRRGAAWPLAARAQQPDQVPAIGMLIGYAEDTQKHRPASRGSERGLGSLVG